MTENPKHLDTNDGEPWKAHILRQHQIIREAKRKGRDVDLAEDLLRCFEGILRALEAHRTLILDRDYITSSLILSAPLTLLRR